MNEIFESIKDKSNTNKIKLNNIKQSAIYQLHKKIYIK